MKTKASNGNLADLIGKTVKSITYSSEDGMTLQFSDGTTLDVEGGVPRSYDVEFTVMLP